MISKNLKKDFYVKLQAKKVIVLASYEVDSVAACRILITLFKTDSIQYTLVPVFTTDNIEQAYLEHNAHCNDFLFINCGATIDLLELLNPGGMVNLYIIDAHRPISVTNAFSEQVFVLIRDTEPIDEIPKFQDVFRDDEDEDDENEEPPDEENEDEEEASDEDGEEQEGEKENDGESGSRNKRKKGGFNDEKYLRMAKRQRERRQWEDRRAQILRTYEESSFFSCSSAEIVYELSWLLSKDTNNLLWLAIIGLTDQYLLNRVSKSGTMYLNERDFLGSHVRRLNNLMGSDSESILSVDYMKISAERELRLYLYRHWSIWESFYHSLFTMSQFKLWSLRGQRKHLDFLSSIGLSLQNCKRKFKSVDTKVRNDASVKIISTYEKHFRQGLKSNIWFSSFVAQYGVQNKFSALDVAIAANALLEEVEDSSLTPTEKFMLALDALSHSNSHMVLQAIEKAKRLLQLITDQTKNVLSTNRAVNTGQFVLVNLSSSIKDIKQFRGFNSFKLLGLYIVNCIVSSNNRLGNKSFIITGPSSTEENTTVVLGLPPLLLMEEKYSNIFGKAFETAADMTKARIYQNYLENNYLDIKTEDLVKFLDALTTIMST